METGLVLVFVLLFMIAIAVSVAAYIFSAIGLKTIAEREKVDNSWLAFVPVANLYLTGEILKDHPKIKSGARVIYVTISLFVSYIIFSIATYEESEMGIGSIIVALVTFLIMMALAFYIWFVQYQLLKRYTRHAILLIVLSVVVSSLFYSLTLYFVRKNPRIDLPEEEDQNDFKVIEEESIETQK
jgi:hypothetical protein